MKKRSSIVWRFFDRMEDNKRCVGVLCKLCDTQYKFFGNTTNMRSHLTCKHPLQWELAQNGSLDESSLQYGEETDQSTITVGSRRKKNVRYSVLLDNQNAPNYSGEESQPHIEIQRVDVLTNYESDEHQEDHGATVHLVRQMRNSRGTDEEWLEEDAFQTIEPEKKRKTMPYKRIKREIESPPRRLSFKNNYIPNQIHYEHPERLVIQETQKKDEYSVFGEYVANKLRKVKLPKTRGNLQQLITTILWQAEYGMYDSADAVKRVLAYSVNDNVGNSQEPSGTVLIEQEPNQSTEIEAEYEVKN